MYVCMYQRFQQGFQDSIYIYQTISPKSKFGSMIQDTTLSCKMWNQLQNITRRLRIRINHLLNIPALDDFNESPNKITVW